MLFGETLQLDVLNPSKCGVKDFVYGGEGQYFDVWYDTVLKKHYEEYKVYKFNKDDFRVYEERKKNMENCVYVHYVSKREEAGYSHLRVFTERILLRLSQIQRIEMREGMYILGQTLRGFKVLYKKYGGVDVSEGMVCMNQQGRIKVWVNQQYFRNDKRKSLANVTQESLVKRIFQMVERKIDESSGFTEYIKRKQKHLKQISFESATVFVVRIMFELGIQQIDKINVSIVIKNKEADSSKLKFEKRVSLRNGNRQRMTGADEQPSVKKNTKPRNSIQKTRQNMLFHKAQSVKYFVPVAGQCNRSRSKSNQSEKLNFSKPKRLNTSIDNKLRSPRSPNIIENVGGTSPRNGVQNMGSSASPRNATATTLKLSGSTNSEIKNQSYYRNPERSQSPPTPRRSNKLNQFFRFSTKPLKNVKFIKESIIDHRYVQEDRGLREEVFRGLRFFNRVDDLKRSQYMEEAERRTLHANSAILHFNKSDSGIFKSIFNANIKEIEERMEQQFD